jgi:preprotein translocase subunit SecG
LTPNSPPQQTIKIKKDKIKADGVDNMIEKTLAIAVIICIVLAIGFSFIIGSKKEK